MPETPAPEATTPAKTGPNWLILGGLLLAGIAIGVALGVRLAPPQLIERTLPVPMPCPDCAEKHKASESAPTPPQEDTSDG